MKDARKTDAMAPLGEKYRDTIRVVSMGDFYEELCGGIYVDNTEQIG